MEIINTNLCIIDEMVNLSFIIEGENLNLNLENDDSNEIKKIFLELAKKIRKSPIKIEMKVDKEFDMNSNKLFYDASIEYIKQLNKELEELETDKDLIELRTY